VIGTAGMLVVVLFAATGGYYLVRLLRDRSTEDRVLGITHLLMSIVMIMMALGWSTAIPAVLQILVFTAAALWYVYLLLFRPHAETDTAEIDAGGHHSGRPRLLYHAAMMLAMVWMAVILAPSFGAGVAAAAETGGMTQGGSQPMTGVVENSMTGASGMTQHAWADPVSLAIGVGFGLATIWYVIRFVLTAGRAGRVDGRRLTDLAAYAVMGAGMALSYLVVMR
jgi:multisubunit Na+/H+ antiporter MnhF subunit